MHILINSLEENKGSVSNILKFGALGAILGWPFSAIMVVPPLLEKLWASKASYILIQIIKGGLSQIPLAVRKFSCLVWYQIHYF